MEVNSFTFNGVNSLDMGIYISSRGEYKEPEKDYEVVSVPGRSGDLLFSNNRLKNIEVSYNVLIPPNGWNEDTDAYLAKVRAIKDWLYTSDGYCKLTDTYNPDEYRMAAYTGPYDLDSYFSTAGTVELVFNCMPQRFLTSGEEFVEYTSGSVITNPTAFDADPILKINCQPSTAGGIMVMYRGQQSALHISDSNKQTTIYLDSQLESAFNGYNTESNVGYMSLNQYVSGKYPKLYPGENQIYVSGGVTLASYMPRWRR